MNVDLLTHIGNEIYISQSGRFYFQNQQININTVRYINRMSILNNIFH